MGTVVMLATMTAATNSAATKPPRRRFSPETAKFVKSRPVMRRRVETGYVDAPDGRKIGAGQKQVVAVLKAWLKDRELNYVEFAKTVPGLTPDLMRQYMSNRARLPESRVVAWADGLGLQGRRRNALLDLFAIANANVRLLNMIDWETKIREAGQILSEGR